MVRSFTKRHNDIVGFLYLFFQIYLNKYPVGTVKHETFSMKLTIGQETYIPEPDLMFIHKDNHDRLQPTYLDGAADLVVEVVSKESS